MVPSTANVGYQWGLEKIGSPFHSAKLPNTYELKGGLCQDKHQIYGKLLLSSKNYFEIQFSQN